MSPFTASHRIVPCVFASLLLHALALWGARAIVQPPPAPRAEPRLQVLLLADAMLERPPKPVPAAMPRSQRAATAQRAMATPVAAPPSPAPATVQAPLALADATARPAAVRPMAAAAAPATATGSAATDLQAAPAAGAKAAPGSGAVAGSGAASHVDLPSSGAAYLHNPKPVYPRRSERLGEQGLVLLRVVVTAEGRVKEVGIQSGSGFERLDQAAREAVLAWTFVPGKRDGLAQEMAVEVPIRFTPSQ